MAEAPLLDIKDLSVVYYPTFLSPVHAVRGVSLSIVARETVALVGETGSGKSTVALAAAGLLEDASISGEILFGRSTVAPRRGWLGMVFQEARSVLNPVLTAEDQIVETLRAQTSMNVRTARLKAGALLEDVGITRGEAKQRGFELSGGACQRVGVALALCSEPAVVIADEPTSALDPDLRWEMVELLESMRKKRGLGLLLISHDLELVGRIADQVAVMCRGRIVERGAGKEVLQRPACRRTVELIRAHQWTRERYDRNRASDMEGSWCAQGRCSGCAHGSRCNEAAAESIGDYASDRSGECR